MIVAALCAGNDFASRWCNALGDIGRKRGGIDQLELELGSLPEQILECLRITQARHVDRDAVPALADDGRLPGAERIDAAADHFGGRVHRLRDRQVETRLRLPHDDALTIDDADRPVALPGEAGPLGKRLQHPTRGIDLAGIVEQQAQLAARGGHVAELDVGVVEHVARRFLHHLEPLAGDLRGIGLEQDVAAASKVEAKIDLRIERGKRPGAARQRHQRGYRSDDQQRRDQPQRDAFPGREVEHGLRTRGPLSRWPACRRAAAHRRWWP